MVVEGYSVHFAEEFPKCFLCEFPHGVCWKSQSSYSFNLQIDSDSVFSFFHASSQSGALWDALFLLVEL